MKKLSKKLLSMSLIALISSSMVTSVSAHSGRTDGQGGHNKTSDGTYHYHSGSDRTVEYASPPSSTTSTPKPVATAKPVETPKPTPSPVATPKPVATAKPLETPKPTPPPTQLATPVETPTPTPTVQKITLIVDGEIIALDQPPIIIDGRALVPIRAVLEAMGATVDWNEQSKTITSELNGTTIALTIDSTIGFINNKESKVDVAPQIVNGRALIPLRFVSEAFSAKVDWNEATRTITITTK